MEMHSVISEQHIARRQKPGALRLDVGLIGPARNGRVERQAARFHRAGARPLGYSQSSDRPASRGMIYTPRLSEDIAPRAAKARMTPGNGAAGLAGLFRASLDWASLLKRAEEVVGSRAFAASVAAVVAVAFLAVAIAAVGAVEWRADLGSFVLPEEASSATLLLDLASGETPSEAPTLSMPAMPTTLSMSTYKVARNDTLDAIARRFGLRLDTLISVNGIGDVRRVAAGTSLKVPNIDGVAHTVRKGESLSTIAAAKGVSVVDLIDANDLSSQTILPGQALFIPGARLSSYDLKKALGKLVIWPVPGRISSNFGYRANPFTGIRQFHNGLDIVSPENSTVKSAMDGRVAETGYSSVFGNFVIVTHPEGYQTLYAHLNAIHVKQGSQVAQGKALGLVGSTGYSTGPHLHFGVFRHGVAIDPLKLLSGK